MECEKLFCQTDLKIQLFKLINTKCNAKPCRDKIEKIWSALANGVNSRRFWSVFPVPDGIWLGVFVEKYFQGVLLLASVLFVLYREALVVERLRLLPRMTTVVSSNSTEGKIRFWQFTLYNRVECENYFVKLI